MHANKTNNMHYLDAKHRHMPFDWLCLVSLIMRWQKHTRQTSHLQEVDIQSNADVIHL